ncbi:nuclear transport factor 2 family protein [Rhodohalobacter sp. 8-1]|uniref:nuclear transport factor 2 family protein n=1 Tax=Rhodohalobacter sp. 8-1 TaxID=3131972 RepID=UPI0030EB7030
MQWLIILCIVLSGVFPFQKYSDQVNTDPKEQVEKMIGDFFESMRNSDAADMRSFLTESATLKTVVSGEQGSTHLRQTEISAFMNSVINSEAGSLDEQLTSFTAHVDGNLSTAWMDYSFYYNGEFSHCGVNTMNLIQTESGWKIFSIVDTRRQEGC